MELPLMKRLLGLIPILDSGRHKGQNGRIGVIGGSFEYTGAPYYAAISTLRGGGDLAFIFCSKASAIPIKSYSPECIVFPLISCSEDGFNNEQQNNTKLVHQLTHIHSIVIGPGLGRDVATQRQIEEICKQWNKLKILDADALYYLSTEHSLLLQQLLQHPSQYVLTPNVMELKRLLIHKIDPTLLLSYPQFDIDQVGFQQLKHSEGIVGVVKQLSQKLGGVPIICKGQYDIITNGQHCYIVYEQGAMKRCGGQGDILSGLTGLYAHWAQESGDKDDVLLGCVLASVVTRRAARMAFEQYQYSLTTPQIIKKIGQAFQSVLNQLKSQ